MTPTPRPPWDDRPTIGACSYGNVGRRFWRDDPPPRVSTDAGGIVTRIYYPHDGVLEMMNAQNVTMRQALERVARLNPDAGEIGAGMLATIVSEAKQALASDGYPALHGNTLSFNGLSFRKWTRSRDHGTATYQCRKRGVMFRDASGRPFAWLACHKSYPSFVTVGDCDGKPFYMFGLAPYTAESLGMRDITDNRKLAETVASLLGYDA